ncbi:MAG: APC family permease [Myxococcales bacterium]|nr:APC family permease [Myxococcales bacterium]
MNQTAPRGAPARVIGSWAAYSVVVGSMLGIGIFLAPPSMAQSISNPLVFLGVWLAAGVIILGGAAAYAELGARLPRAGGDYVFQREAFGPSVAFATGWALFAGIFCGSIAAVALALCQYQLPALTGLPLRDMALTLPWVGAITWAQLVAAGIVLGLTALNAAGVRLSAVAQQIVTLLPLVVLVGLALLALGLWGADRAPTPTPGTSMPLTLGSLTAAYLAATFAYSGWNAVIYVAGEVRRPERTLPVALLGGTTSVVALYLLLCGAMIAVLGMGGLAGAGEAGSAVAGALGGAPAGFVMNLLIALCLVATVNSSVLGGSRVAYAMAGDGVFWRRADRLGARGTPVVALWCQGLWSAALILTNQFEALLLAVSLTMIVTGSLSVAAHFVLRHRDPAGAGFSALGHPWLPGLYLATNVVVLYAEVHKAVVGDEGAPLIGLLVVVAAFAAHWVWRRIRR